MLRALIVSVVLSVGATLSATAAELVMMERKGCPFCARFDAEVGRIYDKTDEGRRAPLRRVDIEAPMPVDLAHLAPERITPTFVLVADGHEIGRIRGYPGEAFFFGYVDALVAKLPN